MKIDFCINDTIFLWRDVTGELVNVAPHLHATFAIHKTPGTQRWLVSDVETGSYVGIYPGYPTKGMAIRKARILLRDKTDEELREAWRLKPKHCRQ